MQAPAPLRVVLFIAVSSIAQTNRGKNASGGNTDNAGDAISMDEQERLGRQWVADNDASIVALLKVDGFSRSETDVVTALDEFRNQGVTAYDELRALWKQKPLSFDVLWVYVDGRLGRSTSLYVYVVENTIAAGARVWRHQGGWIDASNKRMAMALGSIAATSDIDRLKDMRKPAMESRARNGRPVSSRDPATHRRVRNEKGKSFKWEVKDDFRYALEKAADCLLDGMSYIKIAKALNEDGLLPPHGKKWNNATIRNLFHNPTTWGHNAIYQRTRIGTWVFDDSEPVPDGIIIARNQHPPFWTGERAQLIQNELRRRAETAHGRAWPGQRSEFSGLVVCVFCGHNMNFHQRRSGVAIYRCVTNPYIKYGGLDWSPCECEQKFITKDDLVSQLTPYIENVIKQGDTSWWQAPLTDMAQRIEQLDAEIEKVRTLIGRLILQRADTPPAAQGILKDQIDAASKRLETMLTNRETWSRETSRQQADTAAIAAAVRDIRLATSAAAFWRREPHRINQALHAMLGKARYFGIQNGVLIGIVRKP